MSHNKKRTHDDSQNREKKGISLCSECLFVATTLIKKLNICFTGGVINLINKQMHGGGGRLEFSVFRFWRSFQFAIFPFLSI